MGLVRVVYDHRVDGPDLVTHEKEVSTHKELCEIVDSYPWKSEIELFDKLGVGGGFYFRLGTSTKYACYQFVPVEIDAGILDFDIVLKPGFLGVFGRKSASKHFDTLSIPEAKEKIKELFDHSIESLYEKYKS